MSFDNPSSFAEWQSSLTSNSGIPQPGRAGRPPQSVWGQPTSNAGTRRGLTLTTSNTTSNPSAAIRRPISSSSPASQTAANSPGNSTFPSLPSTTRVGGSRQPSSASSSSFPPLQPGGQQYGSSNQFVASPRSRTVTPFSLLFSTAQNTYSQGVPGGGGGGAPGGSRSGAYSPSLTGQGTSSPTILGADKSTNPLLSATSTGSGQSSLTKITVAQLLLLLDTINEKEGKAKWDSKAEQIRKVRAQGGRVHVSADIALADRFQRHGSVLKVLRTTPHS